MDLHPPSGSVPPGVFSPSGVCSPHPKLLTYYCFISILTGPALPIVLLVHYFRYHTLRYRFDADGVTMTVGILLRREVALTYRRLQDIHVTRNILQRWLGLATVSCQTASGSSGAELVIEGLLDYEQVREFLYQRMRGARGEATGAGPGAGAPGAAEASGDEALKLLVDIRDGIGALTREVAMLRGSGPSGASPSGGEAKHG